jgi:hypothetical protein
LLPELLLLLMRQQVLHPVMNLLRHRRLRVKVSLLLQCQG